MTSLDVIHPSGAIYSMSDGNPFALLDEEAGMAEVRRITDRGPQQHGDSDIDLRLEPTMYPLGLLLYAQSISDHYANRELALKIFRPSKTPLKFRWTLDNGSVRQIDAHVSGRLVFGGKERRGFSQRFVVPLRAADPTFYDPLLQSVTFGVGATSGNSWSFPLVFPASFGGSTINSTKTIAYTGTWKTNPTVIIKGPVTSPVITNLATGDKLNFTGITINSGDQYTVDCRPGKTSVVNSAGTDKIADLSTDSNIATFSMEADPDALGGLNDINVTGSGANATTEIYLQYYTRYIGF